MQGRQQQRETLETPVARDISTEAVVGTTAIKNTVATAVTPGTKQQE